MSDHLLEMFQRHARERTASHRLHASQRLYVPDADDVGLAGEVAFSREFRQYLDLKNRPRGDDGIDFIVPMLLTVDVKCARKPYFLPCEVGKVAADIYVLAQYKTNVLDAELLGWHWGEVLAKAPTRDLGNNGQVSHCIHRDALHDLSHLRGRIPLLFGLADKS